MDLGVAGMVLLAALMHAGWNGLVKARGDQLVMMGLVAALRYFRRVAECLGVERRLRRHADGQRHGGDRRGFVDADLDRACLDHIVVGGAHGGIVRGQKQHHAGEVDRVVVFPLPAGPVTRMIPPVSLKCCFNDSEMSGGNPRFFKLRYFPEPTNRRTTPFSPNSVGKVLTRISRLSSVPEMRPS